MSTLPEIEEAIAALPDDQFQQLAQWIAERRQDAWDRQIEQDAKAGRLDALWNSAREEIAAGKTMPLDEFFGHQ